MHISDQYFGTGVLSMFECEHYLVDSLGLDTNNSRNFIATMVLGKSLKLISGDNDDGLSCQSTIYQHYIQCMTIPGTL